jgi:hypothetical protein
MNAQLHIRLLDNINILYKEMKKCNAVSSDYAVLLLFGILLGIHSLLSSCVFICL